MAPWTGRQLQSTLGKLTAKNVDTTAQKLVSRCDTRWHVQRLAHLVCQRVQRAYEPTFAWTFDEHRRRLADRLVAALLDRFANSRKSIKGVPTVEGLSGIPLLKADLLSAWLFDKTAVAPVAVSLYNSAALTVSDVRTVILACLDTSYANDRIGDALLLAETAARDLKKDNIEAFSGIVEKIKAQLEQVPEKANERKKSGERLIPSLFDRYWVLVQECADDFKERPCGTPAQPSHTNKVEDVISLSSSSDAIDLPAQSLQRHRFEQAEGETFSMRGAKQPSPEDHEPVVVHEDQPEDNFDRRGSDAKVAGTAEHAAGRSVSGDVKAWPVPAVPQIDNSSTMAADRSVSKDSTGQKTPHRSKSQKQSTRRGVTPTTEVPTPGPSSPPFRRRCPSCSSELASKRDAGAIAYGQALGEPDFTSGPTTHPSEATSISVAGDRLNPPVSFDDEDDSIWVHLATASSPIKVKFDASTRLGDARRLARSLAASLADDDDSNSSSHHPHGRPRTAEPAPIHFLSNGKAGQTVSSGISTIFIEYPHDMTLSQTRKVGERLSTALQGYAV